MHRLEEGGTAEGWHFAQSLPIGQDARGEGVLREEGGGGGGGGLDRALLSPD